MTLLRTQLGNTLRGHRLRQRRTLRDVSGAARVSLGYLWRWKAGQKEASSELLASICDALDVELADLLAEISLELRGPSTPRSVRPPLPRRPRSGGRAGRPAEQAAGTGRRAGSGPGGCSWPAPRRGAARRSRSPPEAPPVLPFTASAPARRTCPVRTPVPGTPWAGRVRDCSTARPARSPSRGSAAARCSRSRRRPASPRARSTTTSGPRTTSPQPWSPRSWRASRPPCRRSCPSTRRWPTLSDELGAHPVLRRLAEERARGPDVAGRRRTASAGPS